MDVCTSMLELPLVLSVMLIVINAPFGMLPCKSHRVALAHRTAFNNTASIIMLSHQLDDSVIKHC
jgi:hypothetical protein